jgi:apolipoprotein N-acyltransferase
MKPPSKYLLLFALNCLLLTLAWHSDSTAFLALTAFVPLFIILHHPPQTYNARLGCYFLAFFTVFLATYFTVYWIRSVGPAAHFITSLTRATTMFLPCLLTLWLRFSRKTKPLTASLVFIAAWIVMELLHDLNIFGLPYGNLGHLLAAYPQLIQWYSITGAIGGSLWILAVNLALTRFVIVLLQRKPAKAPNSANSTGNAPLHPEQSVISLQTSTSANRFTLPGSATVLSIFVLPIILSLILFAQNETRGSKTNIHVIALHTGSDVYEHKYNVDPETLLREYLDETKKQLDPTRTNLIVWPENAITGNVSFNNADTSSAIIHIKKELDISSQQLHSNPRNLPDSTQILHDSPENLHNSSQQLHKGSRNLPGNSQNLLSNSQNLHNPPRNILIAGAVAEERVPPPTPGSYAPNILFNREENRHFKLYNSAIFVQPDGPTAIKVKKKLVPLSEKVPDSRLFAPLLRHIPVLADLNFSSREQQGFPLFAFNNDSCRTTPIICYGTAFSNFVATETHNSGANFLAMIFNEGWMKSKKAYTHFHWFALCRTIENQRFLVKSSNEGITAITDHRGSELGRIGGNINGAVEGTLEVNDRLTFFTRHHRLITIVLLTGGILFIVAALIPRKEKSPRL